MEKIHSSCFEIFFNLFNESFSILSNLAMVKTRFYLTTTNYTLNYKQEQIIKKPLKKELKPTF